MSIIDTHSHIYGLEFKEDINEVVARAKEAGIRHILLPNIDTTSINPMLSLYKSDPTYFSPMMGLHPTEVGDDYVKVLDDMELLLAEEGNPYVAVGEVGLDFYWDQTKRDEQMDAFERQIGWAKRWNLPLSIHARSAHQELVQLMERHRSAHLTGVFHCFGGTREEAEELLSFDGFVLGIGGVLTYKKSVLADVLQYVPLSRVVIETDSPYLAPVPYRGKRNESAYACEILKKMADIYGMTTECISEETNENVKRVFHVS